MEKDAETNQLNAEDEKELPALFVSHGGGPCFFMSSEEGLLGKMNCNSEEAKFFRNLVENFDLPKKPKAIILFSAHWEASPSKKNLSHQFEFETLADSQPGLLYDYYGFPEETYQLEYPAKVPLELLSEVKQLIEAPASDSSQPEFKDWELKLNLRKGRGYDHGVFIPLKLMYPEANIPVIQISLHSSLRPDLHVLLGQKLAPLRKKGYFLIGSGSSTHNLEEIFQTPSENPPAKWSKDFISWLNSVVTTRVFPAIPTQSNSNSAKNSSSVCDSSAEIRLKMLQEWEKRTFPFGRKSHPREEHFLPLLIIAGSANGSPGVKLAEFWPHSCAVQTFYLF